MWPGCLKRLPVDPSGAAGGHTNDDEGAGHYAEPHVVGDVVVVAAWRPIPLHVIAALTIGFPSRVASADIFVEPPARYLSRDVSFIPPFIDWALTSALREMNPLEETDCIMTGTLPEPVA